MSHDAVGTCAFILQEECKQYGFKFDASLKSVATASKYSDLRVFNLEKVPPLHLFVVHAIHDVSWSKKMINIMICPGLSNNYYQMLQINTFFAAMFMQDAGQYRVPVAKEIKSKIIIYGVLENSDYEENMLFGIGESHDAVLVLFKKLHRRKKHEERFNLGIYKCLQN